jgi:uncharacterized membrane protein
MTPSWTTTDLFIYMVAVINGSIAAHAVGDSGGSCSDVFTADTAWWFITVLTIGYW